jgi:hypothetical protein
LSFCYISYHFSLCGPAITAHGSLDLKQEIQIHILLFDFDKQMRYQNLFCSLKGRKKMEKVKETEDGSEKNNESLQSR